MSLQHIVNSIMSRIPVHRLKLLRQEMERSSRGLELEPFIAAAVRNMDLDSDEQVLRTVPELVDLFQVIDVNGDGSLEWKELVSFLISQVVSIGRLQTPAEALAAVSHNATPESFEDVQCCKVFFGKLFVASRDRVHIYSLDPGASTWISELSARIAVDGEEAFEGGVRQEQVAVLDLAFLEAEDVLLILRSDRYLHALRFTTRTKLTSDSIFFMGVFLLPRHCSRICIRCTPREPYRLFAMSNAFAVDSWTMQVEPTGRVVYSDHRELEAVHSDFLRDMLVVDGPRLKLFVTGSLDKSWAAYDLSTLALRYRRWGANQGIRCLGFDRRSLLLAGCLDHSIAAFDLDSELDLPLFVLTGHTFSIVKVVALPVNRCLSLDSSGEVRYWDTSANDAENRFLSAKRRSDDRFRSIDVFTDVSSLFDSVKNIAVAACGRLTHVFRVVDTTPTEDPPVAVLFSYELLTVISVHPRDIFLWNANSGELTLRITNVGGVGASEVTCAAMNTRSQKVFCGHASGVISVYNAFDGAHLGNIGVYPGLTVRFLVYTCDKILLVICGNGELLAVDDAAESDGSDTILRTCRLVDHYVVSIDFSPALGLIALADTQDTVLLVDYQFFSLEMTLLECTGSKISHLLFVDDYPLLLVCSSMGDFVIMSADPANLRHPIWRISPVVETSQRTLHLPHKYYSSQHAADYLQSKSHIKSAKLLFSYLNASEEETIYKTVLRKSIGLTSSFAEELRLAIDTNQFTVADSVNLIAGYEDGTIGLFQFSTVLQNIRFSRITEEHYASRNQGYDPRRRVEKVLTEFSLERTSVSKSIIRRNTKRLKCSLDCMWRAHTGPVVSISVIRLNKFILSASEDRIVNCWSIYGDLHGVLTRGTKADKVINVSWNSPIDWKSRQIEKEELAIHLKERLQLCPVRSDNQSSKPRRVSIADTGLKLNPLLSTIAGSSVSYSVEQELSERMRLVSQLKGLVTYKQSAKDQHQCLVGTPHTQLTRSLDKLNQEIASNNSSKVNCKLRRKRKNAKTALVVEASGDDVDYLESVLGDTNISFERSVSTVKTRFDAELQVKHAFPPSIILNYCSGSMRWTL